MKKNKKEPKVPRTVTPTIPVTEAVIFDGKAYAKEVEERVLINRVKELNSVGVTPRVAVLLTSRDPASELYVKLKAKAAARVGIEMEIYKTYTYRRDYKYVLNLIGMLNRDKLTHGIMIQLPLGNTFESHKRKILEAIVPEKDVDGLKVNSPFMPATVKAIMTIIHEAERHVLLRKPPPVFVVGSEGMVGKALLKELKKQGYEAKGYDKKPLASWRDTWGVPSFMSLKADVIVSATGTAGIIEARHIQFGAAVIDVGSPKGDVRFKEVKDKASFITPVPGGVGPLTIVSLLENVLTAAYNTLTTHSEGTLS